MTKRLDWRGWKTTQKSYGNGIKRYEVAATPGMS